MNETFWGLYESQMNALRECNSSEEANIIMIETAKFLLDNLDLTEETMQQYDKFSMRKLFSSYGVLGTQVSSFYSEHKSYLDPVASNGAIAKKLALAIQEIETTQSALLCLLEAEKNLFEKEKELETVSSQLNKYINHKFKCLKLIYFAPIQSNAQSYNA